MINAYKILLYISLLVLFSLFSCYKETTIIPGYNSGCFNFIMDSAQEAQLYASRGTQYEIINPIPTLQYLGNIYKLDKMEIRGESTLNFRRKGFSINLDTKITLFINNKPFERKFEEFKLLSLVFDYTYIEYYTATNLFKEAGLWPVFTFLTEVMINNNTQGIYLFIEDPFEYFIEYSNSPIVIRRGYFHSVQKISTKNNLSADSLKLYTDRFNKIYSDILLYDGKQLYDTLSTIIDLENYFTMISFDMLLKNGDYNDEIIYYSINVDGKDVFRVLPWDLDDLFSDQPHEIGRAWALSDLFGTRIYDSMDDIYADVGYKLIYSIEEDLDYKIAKDEFLYNEYLKTLKSVLEKLDEYTIEQIFNNTEDQLLPFYANDAIIDQSKYDVTATNYTLFIKNIAEKKQLVKDRRNWILNELNKLNQSIQ